MKITDVSVELVSVPAVTPPFSWRRGLPGSKPTLTAGWLTVTTDSGQLADLVGAISQDSEARVSGVDGREVVRIANVARDSSTRRERIATARAPVLHLAGFPCLT